MKCVSVCFVLGIMEEWVTYKLVNCNFILPVPISQNRFMFHSRNNFFHHIFHINFQAGGVNTRVTADVRFLQEVFINKQLHMIFLIVHKSKYTDRTRCNIKEFLHISFIAEGKSGNAKLEDTSFVLNFLSPGRSSR